MTGTPPAAAFALRLAEGDNVAVLTGPVRAGERVELSGRTVTVDADLGLGHKLACAPIPAGAAVVKYGAPIGLATRDIAFGAHVHTHNIASAYTRTHGRGGT